MRNTNPAVIPRNHRVEEALEAAVKQGDYSVMERLLDVLSSPYAHSTEQADYSTLPEHQPSLPNLLWYLIIEEVKGDSFYFSQTF